MKFYKQELLYSPDTYPDGSCYPTVYACILNLPSPRTGHVVIYKNGQMIHDPHPSNAGLIKVDHYSYLRRIEGDHKSDEFYLKIDPNGRV